MGQFVGAIRGHGARPARALDFPVVSGNVSLYNETNGEGILPTPAIGGVGLLKDIDVMTSIAVKSAGNRLYLVGETAGHLGQSLYLREVCGREDGPPPPVDLAVERKNGDFVRGLIEVGGVAACHDLSDGGLLVAAAEMALAGDLGVSINLDFGALSPHAALYGEDQARYLVEIADGDAFEAAAAKAGVPVKAIGTVGGDTLNLGGETLISLSELRDIHEGWLPHYMGNA